jgi:hypothetical protein
MVNSITSTADESRSAAKSAERNRGVADKLKLMILWTAVCVPLLWGAMKALEDIGNLPL